MRHIQYIYTQKVKFSRPSFEVGSRAADQQGAARLGSLLSEKLLFSGHTPWDQRIEQLNAQIREKELVHGQLMNQKHKLELELNNLRLEQNNVQKELQDLFERNQKVTNENLPQLTKIAQLLKETWSATDGLTADAAMLSAMFRQQDAPEEHRPNV